MLLNDLISNTVTIKQLAVAIVFDSYCPWKIWAFGKLLMAATALNSEIDFTFFVGL